LKIVKPHLENIIKTAQPDPAEIAGLGAANKDEWVWRSLQAAILRKVVLELIAMLEGMAEEAKQLTKKENTESKDFRLGQAGKAGEK
jgi:hypothetical protein